MLRKLFIIVPMLFSVSMGFAAIFFPDVISEILGISANNAAGKGAIRGDIGAFFCVGAGACALALFKNRSNVLWVPISLFCITIFGRMVDILLTGIGPGAFQPVLIETVLAAMLIAALKMSNR